MCIVFIKVNFIQQLAMFESLLTTLTHLVGSQSSMELIYLIEVFHPFLDDQCIPANCTLCMGLMLSNLEHWKLPEHLRRQT